MDSHRLIAENDGDIDLLLLQDEDTSFSSRLRQCSLFQMLCVPSSLQLALQAQQQLFKTFVVSPVQHKRFSLAAGDCLNYVDIYASGEEYRSNHRNKDIGGESTIGAGNSDGRSSYSTKPTLLLMHGYGSGLGMFFDNYDKFALQFSRIIAVDWRGMGCSSRSRRVPHPFSCCCCYCSYSTCCAGKQDEEVEETEGERAAAAGGGYMEGPAVDYFVTSLHEMVEGLKLSNVVLAGHSLGGYLSARYVMKYHSKNSASHEPTCNMALASSPSPITGLILFSPAGLEPTLHPADRIPPRKVSLKATIATHLVRLNYTPQSLIRAFGPFGRERVHMLVARRFGSDRWSTSDGEMISDYLYHISALPQGGERALNALLELVFTTVEGNAGSSGEGSSYVRPKCLARKPLVPKDLALLAPRGVSVAAHYGTTENKPVPSSISSSAGGSGSGSGGIPLLLLYGDADWMYFPAARKFTDELRDRYGVRASFQLIRNAGHHLYMDNVGHFHSVIDSWLEKEHLCGSI